MLSAVISAGVAADTVTTLIVAERTEARARFTHPVLRDQPASPAFDFETTPSLRLQIDGAHWEGTIGGAYTFTEANIGQTDVGPTRANFQSSLSLGSGIVGIGWHTKRARIHLEEAGNYGQLNLSFLAPQQTIPTVPGTSPPTQPTVLPRYVPATILVFGSRSTLTASGVLDRGWTVGFTAGYAIGGGADFRSRNVSEGGLAEEFTPSAVGTLAYRFGRRDDGVLTVGGRHTLTKLTVDPNVNVPGSATIPTRTAILPAISGSGPTSDEIDASLTWRHALSREVSSLLAAGVAVIREESVGPAAVAAVGSIPDTGWVPVPTGHAVLNEKFGVRALRATATEGLYVTPGLDLITGAVTVPITGIADLSVAESTRTYVAEAGVSRVIPFSNGNRAGATNATQIPAYTVVQASASVIQALGKRFDLSGGLRLLWQFTDSQEIVGRQAPGQEFDSQVVFVALTYHEPPVRL